MTPKARAYFPSGMIFSICASFGVLRRGAQEGEISSAVKWGSFIRVLLSSEYDIAEGLGRKSGVLRQVIVNAENEYGKYQKRPDQSQRGKLYEGGGALSKKRAAKHRELNEKDHRQNKREFEIEEGLVHEIRLHGHRKRYVSEKDLEA